MSTISDKVTKAVIVTQARVRDGIDRLTDDIIELGVY